MVMASNSEIATDRRRLDADRPDPSTTAEQRTQAVHRVEKVAAVALHHREQQVASGVTAQACMFKRGQPGQQHASSFAGVSRQCQCALQDVARRQHTELVTQLARAAAAVEHRDDSVHV